MPTIDQYFGRVTAQGVAATDAYSELQIPAPAVVTGQGSAQSLWVPVLKQIDFELIGGSQGIGVDCQVRTCLMAGDASLYAAWPANGIADPNLIAEWVMTNALTTSGEIIFENVKSISLPGDGLILTAPYMTMIQHNVTTGVSLAANVRIWYDYVTMDKMTYLTSIHGMNL